MTRLVDQALRLWGLEDASYALAAERENRVFRVETRDTVLALRLHRPGYRSDAELRSELEWMAALSEGGLAVPSPVAAKTGAFLVTIDTVQIDALGWLAGSTLSDCLDTLSLPQREEAFFRLGQQMAKLHNLSDACPIPPGFERARWDMDGLLGDAPLWDRFWENPGLSKTDKALVMAFRERARGDLDHIRPDLDFGLIHADLVPSNVLYDQGVLSFIDFDDGGFGFRLFDVATALLKHGEAPDFPKLQTALIAGYRTQRPLDDSRLDVMFCLRALTYVGWNIQRMEESGGLDRNARFIRTAVSLCSAYLEN